MSYSMDVKEELAKQLAPARHCRIAEIAAIIYFCGKFCYGKTDNYIKVHTESLTVASKYFILLEKTFKIRAEVLVKNSHNAMYYQVLVIDRDSVADILKSIKVLDDSGQIIDDTGRISRRIIQNSCCMRAFLRGAFTASGSVTDPYKGYHFEIVAGNQDKAAILEQIFHAFNIESKHTIRKNSYIVYVKEGAQISDTLGVMEAHVAMMKLENARIYKEMRNSINRQVNCEAANISKIASTAMRQRQDIIYIRDNMGLGNLSDGLKEIAFVRIDNPDASLKELGEMLHPPLGKSGVNHRLRRLSEIADDLRKQKEEKCKNDSKKD